MIADAKFNGFLTMGYLSFRCQWHLVEYPTMPLIRSGRLRRILMGEKGV